MIPEGEAVSREDRREMRDSISVRPVLTHTAVNHLGERFPAAREGRAGNRKTGGQTPAWAWGSGIKTLGSALD